MIWYAENVEFTTVEAHREWEEIKGGKYKDHLNFERRMEFVKKHDPETWVKRRIACNLPV